MHPDGVLLPGETGQGADVAAGSVGRVQAGEAAVRRQVLEMAEARDPSVGLNTEPFARTLRTLVFETPALRERALIASHRGVEELVRTLAEESDDPVLTAIAAAQLISARNALIEADHRRIDDGESADAVAEDAEDAAGPANRAFDLIERGLGGYAVRE